MARSFDQKITTLAQLQREERWHVEKMAAKMRAAQDPVLGEQMLAEARAKDKSVRITSAGFASYHEIVTQSSLDFGRKRVEERVSQGKPPIPEPHEIDQMIHDRIGRYLRPCNKEGSGWYSVCADGMLRHHGWRIRRITPAAIDSSLVLDLASLPAAPPDFLSYWRSQAVDYLVA